MRILIIEISDQKQEFTLVLDNFHIVQAAQVDHALTYLVDHLPPQMHLVIATREDPNLPLTRLRARNHLTELRIADLRFDSNEAASFLNQMMGLDLTADQVNTLEKRTEGWIAGIRCR